MSSQAENCHQPPQMMHCKSTPKISGCTTRCQAGRSFFSHGQAWATKSACTAAVSLCMITVMSVGNDAFWHCLNHVTLCDESSDGDSCSWGNYLSLQVMLASTAHLMCSSGTSDTLAMRLITSETSLTSMIKSSRELQKQERILCS